MKKLNRTYVMGIFMVLFSAWIAFESAHIPELLVSNEPGPRLFPFISAIGIAVFAILSMVFDGKKDENKEYLDKAGYTRLAIIIAECLLFAFLMNFIGFWITSMAGLFLFIFTLKGEKKFNVIFCIIFCMLLGSICYFGFTKGFNIPLPKGTLWSSLGIKMI
ncbi:Tripartite tricarboxylate transporter TctB family protein [Oribacterium sp. KHPX15]|uniref:tripartite tricarboxylate transporter TctB family protein n=1 Tax=unclassified Oribacterium TaxID=2629782 RepID=UPI0004E1D5AE|nr:MULTISPECIES: tripartite tricarboxylate transporter TctB family protein [unclassified Oribacterium]SDZ81389.1 Tripartite tricarboxylate transporter TctB family protein [Oribacterium sp. KHPX15]